MHETCGNSVILQNLVSILIGKKMRIILALILSIFHIALIPQSLADSRKHCSNTGAKIETPERLIEACSLVIEQSNGNSQKQSGAYVVRGSIWLSQDKLTGALADVEKAIKINPENIDAYVLKAAVYMKSKKIDEALDLLNKVLQKNQVHLGALCLRSELYVSKNQLEESRIDLEKAVSRLAGGNNEILCEEKNVYLNMGRVYLMKARQARENKEADEAIKYFNSSKVNYFRARKLTNKDSPFYKILQSTIETIKLEILKVKYPL